MSLLEVRDLSKTYPGSRRLFGHRERIVAVSDVSFDVEAGETLALVGESGAGKSTVGRLVNRLVQPDNGTVVLDGVELGALGREEMRRTRRKIQMIFQDPYSSLDPRVVVGVSLVEPLRVLGLAKGEDREAIAVEWLERVGLGRRHLHRYPRELSGGQLQRVCIARALTVHPKLIVCDEPTAALDVSVQAQVLNLMKELQESLGLTYLFISHDLGLVEAISDRVAVMERGRIVETGSREALFDAPASEYTRKLLAAIPSPIPKALRTGDVALVDPSDHVSVWGGPDTVEASEPRADE
jgi:ABC-type glutathione transport system ATPase component